MTSTPKDDETKQPDPIDIHVGGRIRYRRTLLGLSQEKVSDKLGLTFQQLQKYERGTNRVSASRLWQIAKILHCKVEYFFPDQDAEVVQLAPAIDRSAALGRLDTELTTVTSELKVADMRALVAVARGFQSTQLLAQGRGENAGAVTAIAAE